MNRVVTVRVESLDEGLESFHRAWKSRRYQGEFVTFERLSDMARTLRASADASGERTACPPCLGAAAQARREERAPRRETLIGTRPDRNGGTGAVRAIRRDSRRVHDAEESGVTV